MTIIKAYKQFSRRGFHTIDFPSFSWDLSVWETPFVVVDFETSGCDSYKNRPIEIGVVVLQGGEFVEEFSSLINPHQFIPPFITKMTGISNEKAALAPEELEVFSSVKKIFSQKDAVFVAHNAAFDWGFARETFVRTGLYEPRMPQLCTFKLAKRLLPNSLHKNLGALAKYFNISIDGRHHALGDAFATAQILLELLYIAENDFDIKDVGGLLKAQNQNINTFQAVTKTELKIEPFLTQIPEGPGVYKFLDKNKNILYVGKAKILKDRVRSYFQKGSTYTRKTVEMLSKMNSIEWESTETEIGAILLESRQIKLHKPKYNTLEKKYRRYPFLKINLREDYPSVELCFEMKDDGAEYYGPFRSRALAESLLLTIQKMFMLRNCDKTIIKPCKPCFYASIQQCMGACEGKVKMEDYQAEIDKVRSFLSGAESGILDLMQKEMQKLAAKEDYEQASLIKSRLNELRKLFDRPYNIPTSINDNNSIIIAPGVEREKTAEIFIIKSGKLIYQKIIGRKAPLDEIIDVLKNNYFQEEPTLTNQILSVEDIDEIRILVSWLYRNMGIGHYIYIDDKSLPQVIEEIKDALNRLRYLHEPKHLDYEEEHPHFDSSGDKINPYF